MVNINRQSSLVIAKVVGFGSKVGRKCELNHPDFLRIGEELTPTVEEILARAVQMAVDYA